MDQPIQLHIGVYIILQIRVTKSNFLKEIIPISKITSFDVFYHYNQVT